MNNLKTKKISTVSNSLSNCEGVDEYSKKSNHIMNARKIYKIQNITPNEELARKTGCTISALNEIVKKGEGAYYSSGSRPNQTPQSWGLARLASAITAGKAAAVDYNIISKGINLLFLLSKECLRDLTFSCFLFLSSYS